MSWTSHRTHLALALIIGLYALRKLFAVVAVLFMAPIPVALTYGPVVLFGVLWCLAVVATVRAVWRERDRALRRLGLLVLLAAPSVQLNRFFFNVWDVLPWHARIRVGTQTLALDLDLPFLETVWGSVRNVTWQGGVAAGVDLVALALALWLIVAHRKVQARAAALA